MHPPICKRDDGWHRRSTKLRGGWDNHNSTDS